MLEGTKLYQACISKWGKYHQVDKLLEEMAELTQAILKHRHHVDKNEWFRHVLEEVADVELTLNQLKYMLKDYSEEIAIYKQRKVDRLNKILEESKD